MKVLNYIRYAMVILCVTMTFNIEARQELQFVARITGGAGGDEVEGKKGKVTIPTIPAHELENSLLQKAQNTYGHDVILKNFYYSKREECMGPYSGKYILWYEYSTSADVYRYVNVPDQATVVIPAAPKPAPKLTESAAIKQAIEKAMESISPGSRVAINTISTNGDQNREQVKDILLDVLLDGNYKVVAKEYLEKLKEEIEEQQSGDYNSRTTVKTDNFSAVGYYIDIKIKDKAARVYVINVSTGEYASTANQSYN